MSAEEVRKAATEGVDAAAQNPATSTHDDVAAGTAAGVDKAIQGAQAQGKSVGSVPAGTGQGDAVPSADTTPAATEQQAVDESYKSGDSPYEFSKGGDNADEYKAQADRVFGK